MQNIYKSYFKGIFEDKKVLVTGDTGFKGSWLSIWLKELGAEVFGYSLPPRTNNDNFVKCGLHKIISHKDGDVRNSEDLKKYFSEVNPDFAFHLAAQALVLNSYNNPLETFDTNVIGTVNFFEAVRSTSSVKVAINVTSDKCYQNNEQQIGYKEFDPMGGNDPYSASKACSELISNSYLKSFFNTQESCRIATARAGNVIGGGDWAEHRIIPDFYRVIQNNEKLIVRSPYAVRPWQHVLEPLSGYLWLCAKMFLEGNTFCGSWNFGPFENNHHSVVELIKKFIAVTGAGAFDVPSDIEKPHEAQILKLDISKAMKYLKWMPVLDFEDTVKFTVDGYNDEIKNVNVLDRRIKQIDDYINKATNQKLVWTE